MTRRNSFVTGRGPVMSNPEASLLPSPYEYIVPSARPASWVKGLVGLAIIAGCLWAALVLL